MSDAQAPFLPFARPSITQAEKDAVMEVLDSGWITTGPRTKAFEARFAETVGARHAVAMNSATAALHLALEALGVGPGDEVIVPTWTFAASAEVVIYGGATPVLVDVDAATLNALPETIAAAVTPRTRAIICVHLAGLPIDIAELRRRLGPDGPPIVEDAAHAFPSRIGGPDGPYAGTLDRVGAYSFYATKTITTGEGGMLVTNDDAIAARARVMSLHGISRDAWKRYTANGDWFYEIEDAGYKYNMTDIAAALGLVQLARAEQMLARRAAIAARYDDALRRLGVFEFLSCPADRTSARHLYVVKLAASTLRIGRNEFMEELKRRGVGASVHFIPLHMHPYYRDAFGYRPESLPVAQDLYERSISLPFFSAMSEGQVDRVIEVVTSIVEENRR